MRVAVILVSVAYPLLVYFGIGVLEPRWVALLFCGLALARGLATHDSLWLSASIGAAVLAVVSVIGNALMPLKLYPVLVNAVMFVAFFVSLLSPASAIERIARLRDPDLPPAAVAYTRRVTQIWCGFFVFNGSAAFATAWWGTNEIWALYNGLIAYLLIGTLFSLEWLVRRRVMAKAAHG